MQMDQNIQSTVQRIQQQNLRQSTQKRIKQLQNSLERYNNFFQNFIQKALICPISHEYFQNPIITSSGITYQKVQILDYFRIKETNIEPMSKKKLTKQEINNLIPNSSIKSLTDEYKTFLKKQNPQKLQKMRSDPQKMAITQYENSQRGLKIDFPNKTLNHNYRKVDMVNFVKCDWRHFEDMDLSACEIDNNGFEQILRRGSRAFRNIRQLNIADNLITSISGLNRLKHLRRINFQRNKLNHECLQYLRTYKQQNPHVKILY